MSGSPWPYIIFCFAITWVVLGAYLAYNLRRGRQLSEQVPEGEQRWMLFRTRWRSKVGSTSRRGWPLLVRVPRGSVGR